MLEERDEGYSDAEIRERRLLVSYIESLSKDKKRVGSCREPSKFGSCSFDELPRSLRGDRYTGEDRIALFEAYSRFAPVCEICKTRKVTPRRISSPGKFSKYQFTDWNHFCRDCTRISVDLTTEEKSAIIGTALGDGCVSRGHAQSKTCRLSVRHSPAQEEWINYKYRFLHRLKPSISRTENGGWGDEIITVTTKSTKCLNEIQSIVYKDGRARITIEALEMLGDIGLAWWFGDDGSGSDGHSFKLHTESYPKEDVELAAEWFNKKYGYTAVTNSKGKYWFLSMGVEATGKIGEAIERFLPESMQYKLEPYRHYCRKRDSGGLRFGMQKKPQLFCERDSGS